MLASQQTLGVYLPPPPQLWDYRCVPLCLAFYVGAGNQMGGLMLVQEVLYQLGHHPSL